MSIDDLLKTRFIYIDKKLRELEPYNIAIVFDQEYTYDKNVEKWRDEFGEVFTTDEMTDKFYDYKKYDKNNLIMIDYFIVNPFRTNTREFRKIFDNELSATYVMGIKLDENLIIDRNDIEIQLDISSFEETEIDIKGDVIYDYKPTNILAAQLHVSTNMENLDDFLQLMGG